MAGVAFHAVDAMAVETALHVLNVDVTVVALQGRVTGWMAIAAARRIEDGPGAIEGGLRGGVIRCDGGGGRSVRGFGGGREGPRGNWRRGERGLLRVGSDPGERHRDRGDGERD